MTGKWGEIKGKLDLVRVSGEFQLSEIELSGFYSVYYGSTVPCEQRKNIEQFRMNKVSGPSFQTVENSTGTVG